MSPTWHRAFTCQGFQPDCILCFHY
uniref:Chitinase homolog LP6 (lp6) protein n=1 Tax=Pinus taeda TaxID=3352 RepID=V9GZP1_PINTA|nr:hypothetical protein c1 - loblolly pine [Pinus taeda]AAA75094.1 uORFc1; Method: conceptual translation supplied by author [Pinus taeda]